MFAQSVKLVLALWVSANAVWGETKEIRLRNERIVTGERMSPMTARVFPGEETPVSGLYLVQFRSRFEARWRATLRSMDVDLLYYVPDDAFLARMERVDLKRLWSLPYIQYAGPYRADHKVHAQLAHLPGKAADGLPVPIRVLMTADADREAVVHLPVAAVSRASYYRYGVLLDAEATLDQVTALALWPNVLWIEPATKPRLLDEVAVKVVEGRNPTNGHPSATQAAGFNGQGVKVAVADSGLSTGSVETIHPDLAGRVDAFFYYGALTNAADEDGHGTHNAGIIAGNGATGETDENGALYGLGMAPEAHLIVQRIFDGQGAPVEPAGGYEALSRDAVQAGAVVGSNSWGEGDQGSYDSTAWEFDALVRDADLTTPGDQPYILEFSAGNAGPAPQTISSPAVAKNVIATGASENDRRGFPTFRDGPDALAELSSRGPCEDGRLKPDLVAPGTWIASLQSAAALEDKSWGPISSNYQYQGGTSQAGSFVAGAAAVFVQYYRATHTNATPSPALVKAALVNAAVDLGESTGALSAPNNNEGWGRLDIGRILDGSRQYEWVDQTVLLVTGAEFQKSILVGGSGKPLKVTLAYTDCPGFLAAIPALVNDLDLELVAPDGHVYRGNQFLDGESVADAVAADNLNNVEGIRLGAPIPGEYIVRVRARNVVVDARSDTEAVDQDFALVISGELEPPGFGVITLDRETYTVGSVIQLKLFDSDLAGQSSAVARIGGTSQTNALEVRLEAAGGGGLFTGSVMTALAPEVNDGRLHLADGDLIQAEYEDGSPAGLRTAQARADLRPPVISGLVQTNWNGIPVIAWQTDTPASGTLYYGTNASGFLAVTEAELTLAHQVTLNNLASGVTNFFWLVATDAAGNAATNNNEGGFYTLVSTAVPAVLLVNDYETDEDSINLRVSDYTDALDAANVNYQVWDVAREKGYPDDTQLRSFRVVIWRINDNIRLPENTIGGDEQMALQRYLKEGGSLFIASMELLNRLGTNSTFQTQVLHVQAADLDTGAPSVTGVNGDPVGGGMQTDLDFSAFPSVPELGRSDFSDTITPAPDAAVVLLGGAVDLPVGLRYPITGQDSTGRVVFLAFPWDALPVAGEAPNTRASVMRRVLNFLAPGLNGDKAIALDSPLYTIPSRVTVEVTDPSVAGSSQTTVNFFSDIESNAQPVDLVETVRKGVFRGGITLVPEANTAARGQLRSHDGGSIWAEYADGTATGTLQVSAAVDTNAPAINSVLVTPQYEEATVSWNTTKATDALVQFGESTFLGRTAYAAESAAAHAVRLTGLLSDRLYYVQVVSRDGAGNQTVDNNGGQFYTFRTLAGVRPPWVQDMEDGGTNWTTTAASTSEGVWMLGTPQNGRESAAHSGTNAWGSNLTGLPISTGSNWLISPALDLSGGTVASLSFWQDYDFTPRSENDQYEFGRVQISMDNGDTWRMLYTTDGGASAGWERRDIDLTAYLGHIVRLGWDYELYSYDAAPRSGWLVDDVAVTVTNLNFGTIAVSNNLSQARFHLAGPVNRDGQGWFSSYSSAPVGDYVVTFEAVPYYDSPAPRTNTLAAGTVLLFTGDYTFADMNHNGIPDGWEACYLGAVSAVHPAETDGDGDGFSDYAEFMAGTDPTNALSRLSLALPRRLPDGAVRLMWPTTAGRSYRLWKSPNGWDWEVGNDWQRASGLRLAYTLYPTNGTEWFRVEVRP